MANMRDKTFFADKKLKLLFDYFDKENKGIIYVKELEQMLRERFEEDSAKKILQSTLLNNKEEVILLDNISRF